MSGARFIDAFDAVLLDMDGTLVTTEEIWFKAGVSTAARYGVSLPASAAAELHGLDVPPFVERLGSDHGLKAPADEFSAALLAEVMAALGGAEARPGAASLVERVVASGKPTALVSNSSHEVIDATLGPFEWGDLLEQRFSVDEVERGKPAPDLYLHAAASLGVSPRRCLIIEDSFVGVSSAVAAGSTCVAVTFDQEPSGFDLLAGYVVRSLNEVATLIFE